MSACLTEIIDFSKYWISSTDFNQQCRQKLADDGVLVLPEFILPDALEQIKTEGMQIQSQAYYTANNHNVYLAPSDDNFPGHHCRNRQVVSSKGCVTTDQIPDDSLLHVLYNSTTFKKFVSAIVEEKHLYEYADKLSSINMHYASHGQELGWHFDNSSFAVTLLIEKPKYGGEFEYVKDVRDADAGEMNFERTEAVLNGEEPVETLSMDAGSLVLFRGRNSLHRVTPVSGDTTRMLVVLAYNSEPGIAISESASKTFYGRYVPA